eukprot:CAMPEP_0173281786 /NCGR_PEP_ID=MMETSP1143-20121109/6441_1 /TAXON_ID=483371 /ORGANISM="non described non described, Strain CCMP2298" /LENGTH=339 /DNA_ID=CAMNT_0014219251 /DNA_START=142 /DNA_END=1161 /DNA_ORIENTATION=-
MSLPLFSYGVVADPQYVDAEDGSNFTKSRIRRYRQSLQILHKAGRSFQMHGTLCNVVLGDILDGKAASMGIKDRCLQDVFDATERQQPGSWHYVLGNHDYYCFNRVQLSTQLVPNAPQCTPTRLYYDFAPTPGFRFVILDGYEVSQMGAASPQLAAAAESLLRAKNPNYAVGSNDWFKGIPLEDRRYVPYNGGVGQEQYEWLRDTLGKAEQACEKVVVFCHMPVFAPCSQLNNLLWNSEQVLGLLQASPSVCAFIAGHDHDGGYALDAAGVHHIVPPAPLECAVGEVAFGRFDVFSSGMKLQWSGKKPTKTEWPADFPFRPDAPGAASAGAAASTASTS